MSLGKKLKDLRKLGGYSQQEVADYLNVSRQSLSKWENDNGFPDVNNLIQLASFFNLSMDELVNEKLVDSKHPIRREDHYKRVKNFLNIFSILLLVAIFFLLIKFRFYFYNHSIYAWVFMICTLFSLLFFILGTSEHIAKRSRTYFIVAAIGFVSFVLFTFLLSIFLPQTL